MISKIASAMMIAAFVALAGSSAVHAATKQQMKTMKMMSKKKMVRSHNKVMRGEGLSRRDNM